jgi:hypothetical protein
MKFLTPFLLSLPLISYGYNPTAPNECTSIDLRDEFLGKNRNQKKVAWCYAFSAADLLNHHYQIPEKISAADMAISQNQTSLALFVRWLNLNLLSAKNEQMRSSVHQTGFSALALRETMNKGWCPEEVFPSQNWVKKIRDPEGEREEIVGLDEAFKDIARLHSQFHSQGLNQDNLPYYFSFKHVGVKEFTTALEGRTLPQVYKKLQHLICSQERRPFEHHLIPKMVIKNPRIFTLIGSHLGQGAAVSLDYDSRSLRSSESQGVKISNLHTSLLVGRRWNSEMGSCEYLVRDSYGESCQGKYDPSYDCEEGNVWLRESIIYKNMTSVVTLSEE